MCLNRFYWTLSVICFNLSLLLCLFPRFQLYSMHAALGYQKSTLKKKQIWKTVCYFFSFKNPWILNGFHSVKNNSVVHICTSLAKKIAKRMSSVWWNETQPNSFIPSQRLSNLSSVIKKLSNDRRATTEYCMMTKHLIISWSNDKLWWERKLSNLDK